MDDIRLPTPLVSAARFGGPDADILFVNTATQPIDPYTATKFSQIKEVPAGNLFLLEGLHAKGFPSYRAQVQLLNRLL